MQTEGHGVDIIRNLRTDCWNPFMHMHKNFLFHCTQTLFLTFEFLTEHRALRLW